jgi:hypothetical protein
MTTKNLALKTLASIALLIGLYFVVKHLGHSIYNFGVTTLVVLVVQILAGFIASAISITPVGTKPAISVLAVMLVFAGVCTLIALFTSGIAAAAGAVLASICALVYHRSVL